MLDSGMEKDHVRDREPVSLTPMRIVDQWFENCYAELLAESRTRDADENAALLVCTAFIAAKLDKIEQRLRAIQNLGGRD